MEYRLEIKQDGEVKKIKVKDFLNHSLKKMDITEAQREDAKEIIPKISEDENGSYYIAKQLNEKGKVTYHDLLNAYNYFVLGD